MIRNRSLSRDLLIRVAPEDQPYREKVREILLSEPCRGVPSEATQLIGHVYIGSQNNAESLRMLRRLGITHVLNCAGYDGPRTQPEVSPYEGLGIEYHEFRAHDFDTYDIVKHFHEAFNFLDRAHRKGGVVLVHCAMGINRSAATCVAYLMHNKEWPLLKCLQLIKEKRRVVLTNKGFQLQLIQFARSIGKLERLENSHKPREFCLHKLPPRSRRDFYDLPPAPRRHRQVYIEKSYPESRQLEPISTKYIDLRRNSAEFRRQDGNIDLLGLCVKEQLSNGRRSNSLGRYKANGIY